ncbi:MAG TPA: hypothetical protein DER33_02495 [Syntrophomonas sp.]|jgi:hypothetical protein|nr:hypothetical protein [Syntrophomonas sp.]HCF70454.1 hypothetical protein [Syntrophomonas sp.]
MKIIYHCFGGSHSSVTAAALHLGLIDKHRPPTVDELMSLPYFDKTTEADFGSIRFMGIDEYGNEVYVLGKKSMSERLTHILNGLAQILGVEDQVLVVNAMDRVNISMKLGGFTSRRIGLPSVGRPVVSRGTIKAFFQLVNLVEITRLKALRTKQDAGDII